MPTISARRGPLRKIAAASALLATTVAPAAYAAVPPVPGVAEVEALCPGVAGNPLAFGVERRDVPEADLAQARARAVAAGFEDRTPVYTSWSDRMVGVDYTLDVPGGDALGSWGEQFGEALAAAGWEASEDASFAFDAKRFEKDFAAPEGTRRLALEFDLHGERRGITLRCADAAMLVEEQNERDGILSPGSPRPVAPPPGPPLADFLARLDCSDPAVLELFARTEDLDDAGALVEARLGPPFEMHGEADYRHRLVTWLRWRLMNSGKIDEDALWTIEEKVSAEDPRDYEAELVGFMGAVGEVFDAQKARDTAALCQSYRKTIEIMAKQSAEEARRDAALAAAFEAEAARRDIALD